MNQRARLDGQVAFVTGGGGGIGHGIALGLAEAGARVAVFEIFPERAEETAAEIRALGGEALALPGDAMSGAALKQAIAATDAQWGRLDILVNNAGGTTRRPFIEQSERSWQRHIDLNLMSMLHATHAAVPIMLREGRGGAILNVASIEASRAAPGFAIYAACKAGMVSFTRTMAVELGEHGIRANCLAPDHTISPGTMGNRAGPDDPATWRERSAEEVDAMNRVIPLGREGLERECGDAAVFLCSDMAAYVTGTLLPIDGGTWASSGWIKDRAGKWTLNEGLSFGG